jgi:hypothetical protein
MEKIRASFRVSKKNWETFKEKSKENEQDASKLLRLFIKKFNNEKITLKDLL